MLKYLTPLLLALSLTGCGLLYRIDVQQGNVINEDMLDKLKLGMSTSKVRYVMGNPLLVSAFHQSETTQRWDYFYSYRQGWHKPETKRVTLYLENDRLVRVEGDVSKPIEQETVPSGYPGDKPIL